MPHADLAPRTSAVVSGRFRDDEPVFAHLPDGPRFDDMVWDLTPVARRVSLPDRAVDFTTIPGGWELTVREVLMVAVQPDHPAVVDAGVVRRGRPAPLATLVDIFRHLRAIAVWAASRDLPAPSGWCQADADALLADLRTGAHRDGGAALSPSSVSSYVAALKLLREFAPVLTGRGLPFQPWGARSPSNVAGLVVDVENRTPPLRWDTWAPAVAAAWSFVDRFSTDIVAAAKVRAALPPHDHGVAGAAAFDILRSWADGGGKVPLHTGYGRYRGVRGEPNVTMLCRRLGITRSIFNRDHACYRPETQTLLEEMAGEAGRREYGGLWTPTVTVRHADGVDRPWIDELGLAELELLVSILRGAAYVLLASLTGMRDSELQELTRDTATIADGLPALHGVQFKGVGGPDGRARCWFGPPPVFRVIDVLASVSPHPRYLFVRSATGTGSYCPQQDIARLIAFVNADPQSRHGRGHGLGLQPIQPTPTASVNQITLRRSFSVYAAQYPGAELGLGIQLGHAALRATTGYATDSQQQVARLLNRDRQVIAREQVNAIILDAAPTAGAPNGELDTIRAKVVADPTRAGHIIDSLAERYHLGFFNDCMWHEPRAVCGPGGPKLAEGVCRGARCGNAVFRQTHLPAVQAHIRRIDDFLDSGRGHPALLDDLRAQRSLYTRVIADIHTGSAKEGM